MKLLIDTWGWISLFDSRESKHKIVKDLYQTWQRKQAQLITSDYILDETITLLFRRLTFLVALNAVNAIKEATEKGLITLEWVGPKHYHDALILRKQYQDKPFISFTDLTSFSIIKSLQIDDVLTDDEHFVQVGLKVIKHP